MKLSTFRHEHIHIYTTLFSLPETLLILFYPGVRRTAHVTTEKALISEGLLKNMYVITTCTITVGERNFLVLF